MQWWPVALTANVVVATAYAAIAATILRALWRSHQWSRNPLALATAAIFASCALGHGVHVFHAVTTPTMAMHSSRDEAIGGPLVLVDAVTAAIAIWYWTLRGRFPALVRGGVIYEDLRQRQRDALDIHDNVVQGLVMAKLSLELGETEAGMAALEETLEAARHLVTGLVGADGDHLALSPGDLRRVAAAGPR